MGSGEQQHCGHGGYGVTLVLRNRKSAPFSADHMGGK